MKVKSTNNKVPPLVGDGSGHLENDGMLSACPVDINYTKPIPVDAGARPPAGDEDGLGPVKLAEVLEKFEDVHEGWRSKAARGELHIIYNEWLTYVCGWRNFLTLTFKEIRPPDKAYLTFLRLVRTLNEDLFGDHYTRIVHHSYFNYLLGMEFTRSREVCHFHVLTDRPMDYQLIHSWWNKAAGICWIEQVRDTMKTLRYVTKYVCKGGDENIKVYLTSNHRVPRPLPSWWYED